MMKNNNPPAPSGYFISKYSNLKIKTKINESACKSRSTCNHDCSLKTIYLRISDFLKAGVPRSLFTE